MPDPRRLVLLLIILGSSACGCETPAPAPGSETGFAYLQRDRDGFASTHRLAYRFRATDPLAATGPLHRTDRFHDVPYEISLGAFVSADAAVMLHAERVADGSGASNYESLEPARWPDDRFRSEGPTCVEVPLEERDQEHDLHWLHTHGFDPAGSLIVQQFFASTADHNDEVVITLMRRVAGCDGIALEEKLNALRSKVTIEPI